MRLLLFSRSYSDIAGGVEKMSLDLAAGLHSRGHEVTVISFDQKQGESFFPWPLGVDWIKVPLGNPNLKSSFKIRIRRIIFLRKILKFNSFDVAIAFQIGCFVPLKIASLGLKSKIIAAERNSPDLFKFIHHGKTKRFFANLALRFADKITIQFEEYKNLYPSFLVERFAITSNWVDLNTRLVERSTDLNIKVLFIGRLSFQKNVQVLVNALKLLPINYTLTIVGEGSEYNFLKRISSSLGVRVKFVSNTANVEALYLEADVFCLPSRWEGFPNVLAEALSYGVPVVGFSGCSGVRELIENDINGCLASGMDDAESLAEAIIRAGQLKLDPGIIRKTVEKYTFDSFIDDWEEAIN